jgi:autotransporter-like protein/autochaperone domain-containing protein
MTRVGKAERKLLLLGTALASTLLFAGISAPTSALAVPCVQPASPTPINFSTLLDNQPITCVNTEPRTGTPNAILLITQGANSFIDVNNSGVLNATAPASDAFALYTTTSGPNSPINIINSGDMTASGLTARGIFAYSSGAGSPISIVNSGDISAAATAGGAFGIQARATDPHSPISLVNSGDIVAMGTGLFGSATGLYARTDGATGSAISIVNSGDLTAIAQIEALGISGETRGDSSPLSIVNRGDITTSASGDTNEPLNGGIFGDTFGLNSPLSLVNSGNITSSGQVNLVFAIYVDTRYDGGPLSIVNSGNLSVNAGNGRAYGIRAFTGGMGSPLSIMNSGDIDAVGLTGDGINARTFGVGSNISVINRARINGADDGIEAITSGAHSDILIDTAGDITATDDAVRGSTFGDNSDVTIINHGKLTVDVDSFADGTVFATSGGPSSEVTIINYGTVTSGSYNAIFAATGGPDSPILVKNSGTLVGGGLLGAGVYAFSYSGTTINNLAKGYITSESFLAINVKGASTLIQNAGRVTGFVDLTNNDDTFINQQGGTWVTKLTSYFGEGSDIVQNLVGGTVKAATDPSVREFSAIAGLERFENKGLITLQDDAVGDALRIRNLTIENLLGHHPPPEAYNGVYFHDSGIVFNGSDKSQLAVDAFLGSPGKSESDLFIIDGDVTGKTKVDVNNTNAGPGVFNKTGIPVVYVGGNVKSDAFFLSQPIDTGFFNYDLFFRPTGSGVFELRSFLGQGAFVLPQLITAAQDQWHSGSSTWFDRTADLRVLLNGGAAPAEDPNAKYAEGTPAPQNFTPAVWARGSGGFLNRDDTEGVTAYGRNYQYNLNRDLQTIDFQSGIDLGKRGLLSENDILVFGALGGYIHSDLNYDAINREFTFNGGQVGGYATYLRGGLFVDTLVNVHLMDLETRTLGFPNSLNATTVGVRTDSGYRFGGFRGGAFIEPLATISVDWANIDGFSQGGNKVSFNDDPNVQGRLGLRVGTTTQLGYGITAEPFVIGSLWGNLSNDNQATLVSTGTTFILEDHLQDVWGEVSGGVNFFNPTASTSVFAKVDVTFGEDIDGIGGKAGMRVSW